MDRLKFIQFGEENVVAILGWKMSPQQIQKLKDKGITKVISALDNDECGKKGTKFLQKHFEVTRFTYLKGVKDPGEMTQESFNKMLKRTMKIFKSNN
jgi:DNA primase